MRDREKEARKWTCDGNDGKSQANGTLRTHTLNSYLPGEHAIPFDVHIVVNCEDSMYSKLDIHRLTSSRNFEVQRLFLALLDWSQVASYSPLDEPIAI